MKKEKRINLWNPNSPIVILILGFMFTLLATGENLPWYIEALLDKKGIILLVVACWLISTVVHSRYEEAVNIQKREIIKLNETIREKQNQLNQSNGIILNKYGEFAKFNKMNRFDEILESFVENNIGIDAVQIYKYSSKINNKTMKIRIDYQQGFASEDVDINSLLQTYYTIDVECFEKINSIVSLWSDLVANDRNSFEEEYLEKILLEKSEDLLTYLVETLNGINSVENIKENDYTYYRALILLISLVGEEQVFSGILDSEEIEACLMQDKRTGILGGVLLRDNYIFKHIGKGSKNGRLYMTFPIKVYEENYVVLISISSSLWDEGRGWNKLLTNFKRDFILRVDNTS